MKLLINDEIYEAGHEFAESILGELGRMALDTYHHALPSWVRAMVKMGAREYCKKQEDALRESHGREIALLMRPAKKQDAVEFLLPFILEKLQEAMTDAELTISIKETCVTNVTISLAANGEPHSDRPGGQAPAHGDLWERENNSLEVSGCSVYEDISSNAPLYP